MLGDGLILGRIASGISRPARICRDMIEIFLHTHVPRSAAALSYYLTISVFPFLICMSAILGSLSIEELAVFAFLEDIVPTEAFSTITGFIGYVGVNRTQLLFTIGLVAMLTSSSAAFRSFIGIMGEIQGSMRFSGLWKGVLSFIFSIGFLVAIYISGLVILSGEWLMQLLDTYFEIGDMLAIWTWTRFVLLFLILFGIIYGVYMISAPRETKRTHRMPGAVAAAVVLVAASMIYSRMISMSIKYALVYGSLASFVIMMVWLYTCAIILIMGNVFNVALHKSHEKEPAPDSKPFTSKHVGRALMALIFNDTERDENEAGGDPVVQALENDNKGGS